MRRRVARADTILRRYAKEGGYEGDYVVWKDGSSGALGDLLADLKHWCDANEVDFDRALAMAETHYEEEVEETKE